MSTTFANSIDSNPIYADRAENDKDGNRIDQTYAKSASLATVATTGAYSDLSGTPSIPTKTSDLTNDSNFITLADVPAQVQSDWTESDSSDPSYIANKPTLAAVATSGDYGDLSNTPTINNVPAVTSSDDNKVLKASYTGGVGSYSWETESGGTVTDVEVDGTSVVSGGVASITMPTELVPTVTSSDDGKVLTASYSGGTGAYTWDTLPANSAVFTVDVDSYQDILTAYNDGKICFAQPAGSKYLYPLTRADVDGIYSNFYFWLDFTPATTYDTNQGIAERTWYTVNSSGWTTRKEKVAPYILAASRISTDLNTATKVLSVSANIPVITNGNDKVLDIADAGRLEVASSAFSGTATKTDTFTRDGYSFYTSDGSQLIGNKWTPFTPYMSGSYTVSFSGGDASKNLTFTSAGAYTWDDNILADPSTFPDSATIHYGLFQGELDANNRMTVNPTLIGNLISDVANVTSADSSVSANVTRPENVSMTINVVAGKKLLTAFYVTYSGVTYFLNTTQNPFAKPSILISQQIGNIAKVVEEAPVDTKSYVRKDGAWVEASGGGGGGTQADWTEDDPLEPSYIENKPTPKTLTAGANISISEGVGTLTISAAPGLPASTSADEGKCLVVDSNGDPEWGTGGKTYTGTDGVVVDNVNDTVGLEAPVDLVGGPGITVDNPDGNTVRISANTDSFFKELYYNATNTNDTAGKVYSLSEPITNFMYAKITVDNMEYTNAPLVYEIDVQHNTTTCQWNSPLRNGNVNNTINLPVCQLKINASGNLVLVARALTYNTYPSPNFTNGDNRGMRVVRVVGIFRIAGGN